MQLEFIPQHEVGRDSLLDILNNVAVQVNKLQDPEDRMMVSGDGQKQGTMGIMWNLPALLCLFIPCSRRYGWDILINHI